MTGDAFLLYEVLVFFLSMSLTVTWNEMSTIKGRLLTDGAFSIGTTDHSWKAMGVATGNGVSWGAIRSACMAFI
jgi:hypothetical protein